MVQMDFLAANHVHIVGLCGQAHRAVIFAIAQLSCCIFMLETDCRAFIDPLSLRDAAKRSEMPTAGRGQPTCVDCERKEKTICLSTVV